MDIPIGLNVINEILLVIEEKEKNNEEKIKELFETNQALKKTINDLKNELNKKNNIIKEIDNLKSEKIKNEFNLLKINNEMNRLIKENDVLKSEKLKNQFNLQEINKEKNRLINENNILKSEKEKKNNLLKINNDLKNDLIEKNKLIENLKKENEKKVKNEIKDKILIKEDDEFDFSDLSEKEKNDPGNKEFYQTLYATENALFKLEEKINKIQGRTPKPLLDKKNYLAVFCKILKTNIGSEITLDAYKNVLNNRIKRDKKLVNYFLQNNDKENYDIVFDRLNNEIRELNELKNLE